MIFKGDRQLTPALTDLLDDSTPKNNRTYSSDKIDYIKGELKSDITIEHERAITKENEINTALNNEVTRATNKETELETTISNEVTRATNKETELETTISNEVTRATNKENEIIKYIHTVIRYNNDNKTYPMGWIKFINNKATITIDDVKQFLKNGGYNSVEKAYHWCGGCCGTTGVRNSADTGTSYVGRVVSGVFYVENEDSIYFKYDYNGTVTILYSRIDIISQQI